MLFISVYTYEPAKRKEIIERRMESLHTPEGAKLIGQWTFIGGGRVFTLFEVDDPLVGAQWTNSWNDLGKFDIFPVVETDKLMKAIKSMAAKQ